MPASIPPCLALSTPLGHMLAGAAVGARRPTLRFVLLAAVVGASPDLDFLPGILVGDPRWLHRGPTHSIAAALLFAAAVLVATRGRWRTAVVLGLAYGSHLLLDWLTVDPTEPYGIPLLWPVTDAYLISPLTPLPQVIHSTASVLNLHNLKLAATELAVFGAAAVLAIRWSRARHRAGDGH